jgi:ubiquinone/menaquinone biosynthesis C-methylase UbiE
MIVDSKTEQSRARYNQIAQEYDESFDGKFTLSYNRYLCDNVTLKEDDSVLDIACGNGRLLSMLAQKARIKAYGIDVSEEMILAAQHNIKDAEFKVCSADNISFVDGMFDLVTVCCAFHHFSEPDVFMREAYRILKGSGKLIIADPSPPPVVRWIENLIIPRMKMGDVKIYKHNELYGFFENAGFTNISHIKEGSKIIIQGIKH